MSPLPLLIKCLGGKVVLVENESVTRVAAMVSLLSPVPVLLTCGPFVLTKVAGVCV